MVASVGVLAGTLALALATGLAAPTISEYPTGDAPDAMTLGPDGNVWFIEAAQSRIVRMTPAGAMTAFPVSGSPGLAGITSGPDGNLWFTERDNDRIGRITPTGTITEFSSGIDGGSEPTGIAAGPDGNLWFTEDADSQIGRITTSGVVTEFNVPGTGDHPTGITAGPDGNLWFTEDTGTGGIGRITPSGTVTEFGPTTGNPTSIAAGADGRLWFTDNADPGSIGRITTTGVITQFSSALAHNGHPQSITAGADGSLYFTETGAGGGRIGRITTSGAITEFTGMSSPPWGITSAADGNIWFSERAGDRVARFTLAPGAITDPATLVHAGDATLAATVNPRSQATSVNFEWGLTTAYGSTTTPVSAGSGGSAQAVTTLLSNLAPSTTYHYRVVAVNGTGISNGSDRTFTTAAAAPGANTAAATAVADTSATLNGLIDPNNAATTYTFEYGLTTAYGAQSPVVPAAAGSDDTVHAVQEVIGTLQRGATYHYRVVAANATGTTTGADQAFTTATAAPEATTDPATGVADTGATLNGSVDPNGGVTTYVFEVGLTTAYDRQVPSVPAPAGADDTVHGVQATMQGLVRGTTYHYRVVAESPAGTAVGADETFTTASAAPGATTGTASEVSTTTALLHGLVDPNGAATTYAFEIGTTAAYGELLPAAPTAAGADDDPHAGEQIAIGLAAGTQYHYRIKATNASGTTYGADQLITTLALPSVAPPPAPAPSASPALPPATRPVLGRSATITATAGSVAVALPGTNVFIPLSAASTVPVGTTIDATRGTLRLTNVRDATGKLQTAIFWGGSFTVHQTRAKKASTVLSLTAPMTCPKSARHLSTLTAKKPRSRQLWGKDNNGRFVTRGRSAVATVRGTLWLVRDTCAGTLVKVTRGEVAVRDLVKERIVIVKAGHSYLARTK